MTRSVPGYHVERLLGSGNQGEVWLGRGPGGGEAVALKWVPTPTAADAAAARREAALLALLDHPHLIELRDFLPLDDAAVLVLELAAAGSLASLLRRRGRLTPAETVAAISPVAAALAHAHEAGVLHGDISAANILFAASGHPKLADLGVARMLLGSGQRLGTPAYLDPTVAAGGVVGPEADVFSLAAVALHALTGCGPWQQPGADLASAEQVLAVAASGSILDLSPRLRSMPPAIASALSRALAADPSRRGSAAELALDLRAALAPVPVVLAGGRIVERAGRHSAARRPSSISRAEPPASAPDAGGRFWSPELSGPLFVPADLTRITPDHERGSAASVGLSGLQDPDSAAHAANRGWAASRARVVRRAGEAVWSWARWSQPGAGGSRSSARAVPPLPGPGLAVRLRASGRQSAANQPTRTSRSATRSRHHMPRQLSARRLGALSVGLVALTAGAVVVGLGSRGPASAAAPERASVEHPTSPAQVGARSLPDAHGRASGSPSRPAPTAQSATGLGLQTILAAVDAQRAQAYAHRDAAVLAQVYAEPALLAADASQLSRSVPPGCGLLGLRTTFTNVRLLAPAAVGLLALEATVTMPAATLRCGGVVIARTAPPPPMRVRMELRMDGGRYRIVSQREI